VEVVIAELSEEIRMSLKSRLSSNGVPKGNSILLYWKVEDPVNTSSAFQRSTRKLDLEMHEMIKKTWDRSRVSRLKCIVQL
jgi:hypothetical protein